MKGIGGNLVCLLLLLVISGCSAPNLKQQADSETHYMLGISYLREKDTTKALKEFLIAVKADPNNKDVHAALGQAYQLKHAYPLAEEHYLKALELSPEEPQVQNNLGALYLDMKSWDKAIEQFRRASSDLLFNETEVSLTGMGVAYYNKAQYLDAIESYRKALAANPGYPQAHFYLGETYAAMNKPDRAIDAYLDAIKIVPGYVQAHYRLAMAYMRLENLGKARASFRRVVELAPDSEPGKLARDYLTITESSPGS